MRVFTLCLVLAALPTIGAAAPFNPYLPTPGGWTPPVEDAHVWAVVTPWEPPTACSPFNPYWSPECRATLFVPFAAFAAVEPEIGRAHV